ncbi:hypothetical protein [Candidatus Palauibacter sp.]|uniref:hypothetical protein n=1 Tax=Candidatus Palauibacter sp. TaxID=3101350 RepID=UPI003B0154CB
MVLLRRSFSAVLPAAVLFVAAMFAGESAGRLISPDPLSASGCPYDLCFNWPDGEGGYDGDCVDFGGPPFSSYCDMQADGTCDMYPCIE